MNFKDIQQLEIYGFTGFKKIGELFNDYSSIPDTKGVYLFLNLDNPNPIFLKMGTGGHFKGKDPNVSIQELEKNWVAETIVVYIGKAGGKTAKATLQSRLKQYLKFGQGKNIGHWGGRYIWQLPKSENLIVCWKELETEEPSAIESHLIGCFKLIYEKRPFANLKD